LKPGQVKKIENGDIIELGKLTYYV
jgi:hypothetical protein